MLHKFLNDFLALAPVQLPELLNQERMELQARTGFFKYKRDKADMLMCFM